MTLVSMCAGGVYPQVGQLVWRGSTSVAHAQQDQVRRVRAPGAATPTPILSAWAVPMCIPWAVAVRD